MNPIAILAYGSLIDDPGAEIGPLITGTKTVITPFPVEYARSSRTRGGAPTLVPFDEGDSVAARLLILTPDTPVGTAKDMLWRRETRRDKGTYRPAERPGPNTVLVEVLDGFEGVRCVLFTRISANISPLTPEHLAEWPFAAPPNPQVARDENGVAYLLRAMSAGVVTRLTDATDDAETSIPEQSARRIFKAADLILRAGRPSLRRGREAAMSAEPLFPLGEVVITATAGSVLGKEDVLPALARHMSGDWGELDA